VTRPAVCDDEGLARNLEGRSAAPGGETSGRRDASRAVAGLRRSATNPGGAARRVAGPRRPADARLGPEPPATLPGRLARGLALTGLALVLGLILWAAGGAPVLEAVR
jgi:hypothetical protein